MEIRMLTKWRLPMSLLTGSLVIGGLLSGPGVLLDGVELASAAAAPPAAESPSTGPESTPPATGEAAPQDDGSQPGSGAAQGTESSEPASANREQAFAEYMTGATLSGHFTVLGQADDGMPKEEYKIIKVEKLPEGDLYRFTARIRYGDTDTELPMDLPVRWAGDTPVITLTNLWIPGLGTFSSRVLIYRDHYAGTWSHGEVGGHLFGVIKK